MMLPFQIYVQYADQIFDLKLNEPEDCSLITIINGVKKEIIEHHVEIGETWELSVTFPWNNQSHVLQSDEELMIVFEEFDSRSKPVIESDLNLYPLVVGFPEDDVRQLLKMSTVAQPDISNGGLPAVEPDILNSGPPAVNDEGDGSDEDSDVSLDDECGEVDDDRHDHCNPDGEDTCLLDSSDEETGLIKMVKYCREHQWRPNPDGSIEISEGQILGNEKTARDVIKRYAIHEGLALARIKNDKCRYTVSCNNKTCDWRVHVSSLPDGVHIHDPKLSAKSLKMQLLERFAVTCSSLTMYRAKKIVLNNLKTDLVTAYAKMKKYGNAITVMNPGSCVKVSLTQVPGTNPRFERFFLSFKASQTGFKKGCRPLIGIDGYHLSGQLGGVMLSATALDGDSGIFPVAFCVWKRYCFRHMLGNFKSTFKDHSMNGKLWSIARAGSKLVFTERMKELGDDSMEAVLCWFLKLLSDCLG
ncbi:hypothetical protein Ddye_028770 [Dipteronia dyeriana]|uniref:Transposase MuDR plant domain-containing protein n=1 Tax=Dipteronia dyeriana TaxID=168575 RepID=A0AAD9WL51_9ROSI|nr:hypothetical protein Ddye_028770 [Dipteronia dyeriana]